VAFSPDGRRIVTGSGDQTAKVWDARTGSPQLELNGHTSTVLSVAFSPDGRRIVTGSGDQTAKVWDARTGWPLLELKGHEGQVQSAAFSPDGTRIVTGSQDLTAKVWDARTGSPPLELKGHTGRVFNAAFSPDGRRIVTGSQDLTAKVWDARTGSPQLELKGPRPVNIVAFSPDGTRIFTRSTPVVPALNMNDSVITEKVWDAQTGQELKGEPIPPTIANNGISPDGRMVAHPDGNIVELVPLQPDEEEAAYRLLYTQPNVWRYRDGYEAARAAKNDFAARFYLKFLPPAEQKILDAQASAEREIAAGRTQDALGHLVTVCAAKPDDTMLALRLAALRGWLGPVVNGVLDDTRLAICVAALQAWFGQDKALTDTCGRALEYAKDTLDPQKLDDLARICCLRATPDKTRQEAALGLARKALQLGKKNSPAARAWYQLTLGMAEYRSDHFAEADAALIALKEFATKGPGPVSPGQALTGVGAFYRAISLFRQGKDNEARKLATEAAALMKPLPKDEKNPLADDASPDDLILWLAYKEAKATIKFDSAPPPKAKPDQK
jgi:hypothetical protein